MKKILSLFVLLLAAVSINAFADVGCKYNGDATKCVAITNIDFKAQPGSDILTTVGLTRAVPVLGSTMFATGVANGGAASVASNVAALPVGFAFVRKVVDSDGNAAFTAGTLANGKPGQYLSIYVAGLSPTGATTGGNYTVTPALSTGFTSFKLSAVNDVITLHFVDTVIGWTIVNYSAGASNSITITLKN